MDSVSFQQGTMAGTRGGKSRGLWASVLAGVLAASVPASADGPLKLSGVSAQGREHELGPGRKVGHASSRLAPAESIRPGLKPANLRLEDLSLDEAPAIGALTPDLVLPEAVAADPGAALLAEGQEKPAGGAVPAAPEVAGARDAVPPGASREAAPETAAVAPVVTPAAVLPPAMDLARWTVPGFLKDRAALVDALGAAAPAARPDARMEMAEFYLAQTMVPEGLDMLRGLGEEKLTPAQDIRRRALETALKLTGGAQAPEDAPLGPAYAGWKDAPLWDLMADVRAGRLEDAGPAFNGALQVLDAASPQLSEALLPPLMEAAIDSGSWAASGAIAARMADDPHLRNSTAYNYLLGRASQEAKEGAKAFDAYAKAAEGDDAYAQRARIALADMGLAGGTGSLQQTRDMIENVRYEWRGDQLELDMLMRLATVSDRLRDRPETLAAIGEILREFPGTPEADRVQRRAVVLLDEVYDQGESGKMPLSDFLGLHRRISPDFRLMPGFDRDAEKLAKRLSDIGASAWAAEEYGDIIAGLRNGIAAGLWPEDGQRMAELKLDQADALLAGGQAHEAEQLLSDGAPVPQPLADRAGELQARALAALGDEDKALSVAVAAPDAAHLRLQAEGYRGRKDWAAAANRYDQLRGSYPSDFGFPDAVGLFLSNYELGKYSAAADVAKSFPALTKTPQWKTIAMAMLAAPADLSPLREHAARDRLDAVGGALSEIQATGISTAQAGAPADPSAVAQGLSPGS